MMDERLHDQHLQTLLARFYHWEQEQPDAIFLRQPFGQRWLELSYAQAGQVARKLCTALQQLGLQAGDHVGILSKNCYHWVLTDLALMMGRFVSVPFYASLPKESLQEVIQLSDIKALFVGKLDTWGDKAVAVPSAVSMIRFPHYDGNARITTGHDWDTLIEDAEPMTGIPLPHLNELWTILFTSGTTGTPKGVMHTQRNPALVLRIEELTAFTGALKLNRKKWFSYLPLNHVAERIGVLANCLVNGGSISFAESIDTFAANLRSVQPSFIFAVPRIWTKFHQAVTAKIPAHLLKSLFKIPGVGTIVKRYLRRAMGLGHVEIAGTGAAITPAYLKNWYRELGIHLVEAYGMTEVCGSICNGPQTDAPLDAVGTAVPFCAVTLEADTQQILMQAPYQMTGYYRAPEKTAEVLRNGWIHSGDRGTIDEQGYVRVIGRLSDAFKTSKGQFIVPNPLEEQLAQNEYLEQVCVVGLGCSQPIALVNLSPIAKQADPLNIKQSIEETINLINNELASYNKISTLVIDSNLWSETNNLLTPTQKVRRVALDELYSTRYEEWHSMDQVVVWVDG